MTNGQVALNQTTNAIPTNGTNAVQTLVIGGTPTAGKIGFSWNGGQTYFATWSATTATLLANIQAALDSIFNSGGASAFNITATNSTLSSGIGNVLLSFQGYYAALPQALITVMNSLTGTSPTATNSTTTIGVQATDRQAAPGEKVIFTGAGNANTVMALTVAAATGGTFTISGTTAQNTGQILTTNAISWSATNGTLVSNIQSATDTTFGTNNVIWTVGTLTAGLGSIVGTFGGTNGFSAIPVWTANGSSLTGTGAAVTFAITTAGGTVGRTTAVPIPYTNYSTTFCAPSWSPAGEGLHISYGSPAVGSSTAIHAAVSDTGSSITITTGITNTALAACPRTVVATPGGTTGNVTAVSCIVVGTDCNGNALTETLPAFTAGAATAVTSINAFASVTSIIQPAIGTSVTVAYGTGPKLGLGIPISLTGGIDAWLAGVLEATKPVTIPSTNGLISGNLFSITSSLSSSSTLAIRIIPS